MAYNDLQCIHVAPYVRNLLKESLQYLDSGLESALLKNSGSDQRLESFLGNRTHLSPHNSESRRIQELL